MVSVALGTETDSSILCPASFNSVVGFKPTVGLTSRAGVIPVSPRQDTIGPICRTVADAVHVLDTIVGIDSNDNTTSEVSQYIPVGGYGQFLNSNGLKGKRLGIVSRMFLLLKDDAFLNQTFEQHFTTLREQGAILVENLEIANLEDICDFTSSGEFVAMLAEFKIALNAYLGDLVKSPVRTLGEVIAFNKNNSYLEKNDDYGQNLLEAAEETKGMGAKELEALSNIAKLSRDGFEKLMTDKNLDALVTYANTASSIFATGGFPGIVVPAGYHDTDNYPFGICFGGLKGSEPKLIEIAYKADYQRKAKAPGYYSGLHGIPVLLKDNIGTRDKLNTTAGSFALLGSVLPRDASVVTKLRSAGAIILGKASLSEWAQFRSLTAPPGSSPRGGQGKDPFVLSASPCGSSSRPAISVAANSVAVSLGTETKGSILCPASFNSVVGIKPTVGLTSRAGVIPVTPRQDTIGPICRTVTDAVYVLDVIVGYDYKDQATKEALKYIPRGGYKQFLGACGLKGKRLGIVRNPFFTSGSGSLQIQAFEQHFQTLRQGGAVLVDHLEIANIDTILNFSLSGEAIASLAEFKLAINSYLKTLWCPQFDLWRIS
ncbi:hypothetical protein ACLB2K_017153 [Fragaria x ananassa]